MALTSPRGSARTFPEAPIDWIGKPEEWIRKIAETANNAINGRLFATATNSVKARPLEERFADVANVKDENGKLNGTDDDTQALKDADARAVTNGVPLVATGGTLLISSQVTLSSPVIDFSSIEIKLADNFLADPAIIYSPAGSPDVRVNTHISIDGNKANVPANPVAFQIDGINSPHTEIHFHGHNCGGTACKLVNSVEKAELHISGFGCGIVLEEVGGAATPDENLIFLAGNQCDQWYIRSGGTSSHVIFRTENQNAATGTYPVVITGTKSLTLSGLMRVNRNGSVSVNMTDADDTLINFANLVDVDPEGAVAVLVTKARSISGQINLIRPTTGGFDIKEVIAGGLLDMTVTGMTGGTGLKLGDTAGGTLVNDLGIRYSYTKGTAGLTVLNSEKVGGVTVHYNGSALPITISDTIGSGFKLYLPADYIVDDVAVTVTSSADPVIVFEGGVTEALIRAYTTPNRGMRVEAIGDQVDIPAFYTNQGATDGWQKPTMADL